MSQALPTPPSCGTHRKPGSATLRRIRSVSHRVAEGLCGDGGIRRNLETVRAALGEVESRTTAAMTEVAAGTKGEAIGVDEDSFYWVGVADPCDHATCYDMTLTCFSATFIWMFGPRSFRI